MVRSNPPNEVTDRLRPQLSTFRDQTGTELFDLPDAPRPDPDTPAPLRFLPAYDNVLLSHANRNRLIPDARPVPLPAGNGGRSGTLLVNGFFAATRKITSRSDTATLHINPFRALTEHDAITEEGQRLLAFASADAARYEITVAPIA
jgi:hypothetical protein